MKILDSIKTLGRFAADLVFPISCVVCGKEGKFLCTICAPKLERLDKQLCIVCKKPAAYGKTHADCVTRNSADGIISATTYTDPRVKKLIGTFKYEFIYDLADPLSQMIVEKINSEGLNGYFSDFIVVPVPLHKRRLNWRGFNQAELLAQALSLNLKVESKSNLVKRIRFTAPQTTLKAEARQINIQDAFEVTEPVAGKKILLVDDVVTTGSTLNEIAKLLKKQKASEIWATTVAHG